MNSDPTVSGLVELLEKRHRKDAELLKELKQRVFDLEEEVAYNHDEVPNGGFQELTGLQREELSVMLSELDRVRRKLTAWERGFVSSANIWWEQRERLTVGQYETLCNVYDRNVEKFGFARMSRR